MKTVVESNTEIWCVLNCCGTHSAHTTTVPILTYTVEALGLGESVKQDGCQIGKKVFNSFGQRS
jgi:hypothetical protein